MKTFVVVFSALIVAVAANSVHRNTGWGAPSGISVDLELAGALDAVGSGAAAADQQLQLGASGDSHVPASIVSSSGIFAGVEQTGEIVQGANAQLSSGNTNTVQTVTVDQAALAADSLSADIIGANAASAANSAETSASGEGSLAASAASVNDVSRP